MKKTVKWSGYLAVAVNRRGCSPDFAQNWSVAAKLSVGKPKVSKDEVAVKISVELPVSLFEVPQLEARISIPETSVTPLVVDMEARDNVAELISQATGFDVRLVPVEGEGK